MAVSAGMQVRTFQKLLVVRKTPGNVVFRAFGPHRDVGGF